MSFALNPSTEGLSVTFSFVHSHLRHHLDAFQILSTGSPHISQTYRPAEPGDVLGPQMHSQESPFTDWDKGTRIRRLRPKSHRQPNQGVPISTTEELIFVAATEHTELAITIALLSPSVITEEDLKEISQDADQFRNRFYLVNPPIDDGFPRQQLRFDPSHSACA